ncbi:MAG: hypothetical protein AAGI53_11485 [Planctomycetota bacterium]
MFATVKWSGNFCVRAILLSPGVHLEQGNPSVGDDVRLFLTNGREIAAVVVGRGLNHTPKWVFEHSRHEVERIIVATRILVVTLGLFGAHVLTVDD